MWFILNDLDYLYAGPILEFPAGVIQVLIIAAIRDPNSLGCVLIGEKNWTILPMAIPLVLTLLSPAPKLGERKVPQVHLRGMTKKKRLLGFILVLCWVSQFFYLVRFAVLNLIHKWVGFEFRLYIFHIFRSAQTTGSYGMEPIDTPTCMEFYHKNKNKLVWSSNSSFTSL